MGWLRVKSTGQNSWILSPGVTPQITNSQARAFCFTTFTCIKHPEKVLGSSPQGERALSLTPTQNPVMALGLPTLHQNQPKPQHPPEGFPFFLFLGAHPVLLVQCLWAGGKRDGVHTPTRVGHQHRAQNTNLSKEGTIWVHSTAARIKPRERQDDAVCWSTTSSPSDHPSELPLSDSQQPPTHLHLPALAALPHTAPQSCSSVYLSVRTCLFTVHRRAWDNLEPLSQPFNLVHVSLSVKAAADKFCLIHDSWQAS